MTLKTRMIFGSIAAQHDNLGDIAIRRVFFDAFARQGHPLVLLTHKMPKAYIDLFQLAGDVKMVSSPMRFQFQLIWEALNGRADLIYAPGPHVLEDAPADLLKTALMLANAVLIRFKGGVIQTAGRALRGKGRIAVYLERRLIAMMKNYVVRDSVSDSVVGRPLVLAPDLALGRERTSPRNSRLFVACSFRSDTVISSATFGTLAIQLTTAGFQVVLVSQVKRDDTQHERLAAEFGLQAFLWGTKSHAEQQIVVDDVYSNSHAVVSNRLHGLIFGITSGALPIEYRTGTSDKIRSTLTPWFGAVPVVDQTNHENPGEDVISIEALELSSVEFESAAQNAYELVQGVLKTLRASATNPTVRN